MSTLISLEECLDCRVSLLLLFADSLLMLIHLELVVSVLCIMCVCTVSD